MSKDLEQVAMAILRENDRGDLVVPFKVLGSMKAEGGDSLVLADLIHPNPVGHAVIADAFANACHIE